MSSVTEASANAHQTPADAFGISLEDYLLPAQEQIQMVDQDGLAATPGARQAGHEYEIPDHETLLAAYRSLVIGRRINEQNSALVRQGRMAVYPSSHGQEACQVAAALALQSDDWLFPTYRDTVAVITKGVPPMEAMVSFRGDWHSGYNPKDHRVSIQSTPLTTQLLHAVGVAKAAKLRGEDTVVLAMCGDGATSEGDFHEALNFAAVFKLPVVFFVQNNKYAISVPLAQQSAAPSLAHKAVGYGLAGERVDGNDLVALLAVLTRAVRLCREGHGPLLVEANTYRIQSHTNADDATRYRQDAEVQEWIKRDPVDRMTVFLEDQGILTDDIAAQIRNDSEDVAAQLRAGMNADVTPDPLDMFRFVYAHENPQLRQQQELLRDEIAREAE